MKSWQLLLLFPFLCACASNLATGAFAGGVVGGVGGGVREGKKGGLIGSATGILLGGITGWILDAGEKSAIEQKAPRTLERMERLQPLTLNDIIRLAQSGIKEEKILGYLNEANFSYSLSSSQIQRLKNSGVSEKVILFMSEKTQGES